MSKIENRIQTLQDNIKQWSDDTFGKYRNGKPIANHLKKEVDEVLEAIRNLRRAEYLINGVDAGADEERLNKARTRVKFELADCLTLLLDVASHERINVSELLDASEEKMEINKKRKWGKPDENGVVEHIPK